MPKKFCEVLLQAVVEPCVLRAKEEKEDFDST